MFLKRTSGNVHAVFSNLSACSGVFHAVFTRQCPPCGSGSQKEAVFECTGARELIFLNQMHGSRVAVINTQEDAAREAKTQEAADAVISRVPGIALAIRTADCQAVMLYDPEINAAANIHSGWRGSISNITGACIQAMKENFGTRPENVRAAIGPSLGPCCAEFVNYKREIPENLWKYMDEKKRFDFWQITRDQLAAAGVRQDSIETANICTMCNTHIFYSYRAEKTKNRFMSIIGLKENRT
ncbi:MAG: peptidoglycan editing factor PgeF [Desulfosalsimonas sp.]